MEANDGGWSLSGFFLFMAVIPFFVAAVMYILASFLPDVIAYLSERGKMWGCFVIMFPVMLVVWIIRYKGYPEGNWEDSFPFRQWGAAAGWWWVGAIPSAILYFVIRA